MKHKRLGEILIEEFHLKEDAIAGALRIQEEKGGRIGEILIRQKRITESDLLHALGIQFHITVSPSLSLEGLDTEFATKIPIQFLKKYRMAPVANGKEATIAINDPLFFSHWMTCVRSLAWMVRTLSLLLTRTFFPLSTLPMT